MQIIVMSVCAYVFIRVYEYLYHRYWNHLLTLGISFSQDAAFEGDALFLTETLANKKLMPLAWLAVKFQISKHLLFDEQTRSVSDANYKNDLFSIMGRREITRRMRITCAKRGYYTINSANIVSYNLLFTEKVITDISFADKSAAGSRTRLLVYPKLLSQDDITQGGGDIEGLITARRFINPDYFELKGIREYAPMDNFKSVNTGASAKMGCLMVNIYGQTISKDVTIYLNLQPYAAYTDPALLEKAISLAASLAKLYIEQGTCVRVISGSLDIIEKDIIDTGAGSSVSHLYSIFASLARLDLNSQAAPIIDFLPKPAYYANENKIHILISTYKDEALCARHNELKTYYHNMYWIMPQTADTKTGAAADGIIKWETAQMVHNA